jgi:hypothetical protein
MGGKRLGAGRRAETEILVRLGCDKILREGIHRSGTVVSEIGK